MVDGGTGDHRRAALLLGAARGLRERVGSTVYGYYLPDPALRARAEDEARAHLGADALIEALDAGHALDVPAVVALALSGTAPAG